MRAKHVKEFDGENYLIVKKLIFPSIPAIVVGSAAILLHKLFLVLLCFNCYLEL